MATRRTRWRSPLGLALRWSLLAACIGLLIAIHAMSRGWSSDAHGIPFAYVVFHKGSVMLGHNSQGVYFIPLDTNTGPGLPFHQVLGVRGMVNASRAIVWVPASMILAVLLPITATVWTATAWRRFRRRRSGRCPECGYSRAGLAGPRCPECGSAWTAPPHAAAK
jgi:hypothetical protein